jgi:hydrogenase expression/formation protein HypC
VGPQPQGAWLLTFLDSARQVLAEEDARRIDAALDALDAVLRGEAPDVDSLFADLVNREPPRPDLPAGGGE